MAGEIDTILAQLHIPAVRVTGLCPPEPCFHGDLVPRAVKFLLLAICLTVLPRVQAQTMTAPDITKQPTLYVVPYAHLDTQWRWEFPR